MLIMIFLCTGLISCTEQNEEIQLTSSSKKAIELYKEAREFAEDGQIKQALEKIDKAIELDEKFAMAYYLKGIYANNYDLEIEYLQKADLLAKNVTEGEKNIISAYLAFINGNEKIKNESFKYLVENYPNDKRVYHFSGYIYFVEDKYELARENFLKALDIDDNFPLSVRMMGILNMTQKNYIEAEKWLKKYLELKPDIPRSYASFGNYLYNVERYDEAIDYYKKALAIDNNFHSAIDNIGKIYLLQKNYAEARKYYNELFQKSDLASLQFQAIYSIGNSYLYENDKENAIKSFEKYIKQAQLIDSPYYEVFGNFFLGYVYACCVNPKKGIEYYDRALALLEESDISVGQRSNIESYTMIWKSQALIDDKNFDEAENELMACSKIVKELENTELDNWITALRAYSDIKQNNYSSAIAKLEKVSFDAPIMAYFNGLAYEGKGEKEKAKQYFEQLVNEKRSNIDIAMFYNKAKEKISTLN